MAKFALQSQTQAIIPRAKAHDTPNDGTKQALNRYTEKIIGTDYS